MIATADDSEMLCMFDTEKIEAKGKPRYSSKIKTSANAPGSLKQKDLFGLGYPYFICSYGEHVAVSTDFGICLLEYK